MAYSSSMFCFRLSAGWLWPAEEKSLRVIDAKVGEHLQRFVVFDAFCDRLVPELAGQADDCFNDVVA